MNACLIDVSDADIMTFGKYNNTSIAYIIENDWRYFSWLRMNTGKASPLGKIIFQEKYKDMYERRLERYRETGE